MKQDQPDTAPREMTPEESTAQWIASQKKAQTEDILNTTKGFRYYAVDVNGRKDGSLTALRARLHARGYRRCSEVGDPAYCASVPNAEVWRITEKQYQALWALRVERDAEARRRAEAPTAS